MEPQSMAAASGHEACRGVSSRPSRTKRGGGVWLAGSLGLLLAGLIVSLLAAQSIAHRDAAQSHRNFERSASVISSGLQLAIRHEEDLVLNASGYVVANPDATQSEFAAWADSARILARYPKLLGLGFAVVVPADELDAFVERLVRDPADGVVASSFVVTPPGERDFYCLSSLTVLRSVAVAPPGKDWCAGAEYGPTNIVARDTGETIYTPVDIGDASLLSVNVPVYRRGSVPDTLAERRAEFLGWIGTASRPDLLLADALQGRTQIGITLRLESESSTVSFGAGAEMMIDPEVVHTDLGGGWSTSVSGPHISSSIADQDNALTTLAVGVLLSLMVAALAYVLGTSRARAMRMVEERTSELRYQALHDSLTGLPNRTVIVNRIEQLLQRNRRKGTVCSTLYIDLDDFKNINDTLGHDTGDKLLMAVARRLDSLLLEADTIGRMGGDEFVVLLDGSATDVSPEIVAERLLAILGRPFHVSGVDTPMSVSVSIGIASGDRVAGGDLLRDADVALYRAKAGGKSRFQTFRPAMQTEVSRRVELEFGLRTAIDEQQFRLEFQPIYRTDDLTLVAAEALLRWDHPTFGVVDPDEFIPLLEQSALINDVGAWVLENACMEAARWWLNGCDARITVNVSARQLDDDSILRDIERALDRSGLAAVALTIEVTETALMQNTERVIRRLRAIRDLGVTIAVDDFGTGYSSLAYLREFPVDALKIDRHFVNAVADSEESRALIRTFVQLSRSLGLRTIAEGVETAEELAHLRFEQVDLVQGFYLSKPVPADELIGDLAGRGYSARI